LKKALSHATLTESSEIILKLEKTSADQVFDHCLPVLRGLCISS